MTEERHGELVVETGEDAGQVYPLRPGKLVVIGREGNFRISDPAISRRHCEISFHEGVYWVQDAGSRWGTFVNETQIQSHALVAGDRIRVGQHVIRFDMDEPPPPVAPLHVATPAPLLLMEEDEEEDLRTAPPTLTPASVSLDPEPGGAVADGGVAGWGHDDGIPEVVPVVAAAPVSGAPPSLTPPPAPPEFVVPEGCCGSCRRPIPMAEDRTMVADPTASPGASQTYCPSCLAQYPLLGQVLANHLCRRVLGAGGMGVVYLGEHTVMGRLAALKTLKVMASAEPVLVQRLLREATAGGRINHPNIVSVHDTGEQGEVAYVVMEYVPGENLADALDREGRFTPSRALHFATQIADALAAAFWLGYIHRDIKPENILLMSGDVVKVTDFGLAKNLKEGELGGLTRTGQVLGTMVYIAPEQIVSSKGSDQRVDIYSLGATFFHLIAGRPPFDAREPIRLLMQIRKEEPPPLRSLVPEVPEVLEAIITRCLRKDPAERYQRPEDLLADLIAARAVVA